MREIDIDIMIPVRELVEKEYIAGNVTQKVVDIYFEHLVDKKAPTSATIE